MMATNTTSSNEKYHAVLLLALLLAIKHVSCEVSLTSTINGILKGGEKVNFTCRTVGSLFLSWRSAEYIGEPDINLAEPDQIVSPNNYTSAMLTKLSTDNGQHVLESVLTITVQPQISLANITCLSVGTGQQENIVFNLPSADNPQVLCGNPDVCPGDNRTFICETRGSDDHIWFSNEYTGRDGIMASNGNMSNSSVVVILTASYVQNGVKVLRSEFNITVSPAIANDRRQYITCVNHNLGSENIFAIQMGSNCTSLTIPTTVPVSTSNPPLVPASSSYNNLVIFIPIIVVMALVIIALSVYVTYLRFIMFNRTKIMHSPKVQVDVELKERET